MGKEVRAKPEANKIIHQLGKEVRAKPEANKIIHQYFCIIRRRH